ncbi:ribonuclease H-like domain-containing protein [Tanacetum coccineum]
MLDEYNALITNGTWVLVPRLTNVNVFRSMWLYRHKFHVDGSLSRHKDCLVANGCSQHHGIDYYETFSLMVKPATIHAVLTSQRFASFSTRIGFHHSKTDASLFVYHHGYDIAYLLLYVDDIILTASSAALLQRIITSLHREFAMTDHGSLNYFLEEILELAHIEHCNPCITPFDTESKLGPEVCLYIHDPWEPHTLALKRILCYVRGTLDHGLQLHALPTNQLVAYIDANWAGCLVTRRTEAEYRRVTNVVAETDCVETRRGGLEMEIAMFVENVRVKEYGIRVGEEYEEDMIEEKNRRGEDKMLKSEED